MSRAATNCIQLCCRTVLAWESILYSASQWWENYPWFSGWHMELLPTTHKSKRTISRQSSLQFPCSYDRQPHITTTAVFPIWPRRFVLEERSTSAHTLAVTFFFVPYRAVSMACTFRFVSVSNNTAVPCVLLVHRNVPCRFSTVFHTAELRTHFSLTHWTSVHVFCTQLSLQQGVQIDNSM